MGPEVQQYDESVKGLHTRRRVENAEWTFADYLSVSLRRNRDRKLAYLWT